MNAREPEPLKPYSNCQGLKKILLWFFVGVPLIVLTLIGLVLWLASGSDPSPILFQ